MSTTEIRARRPHRVALLTLLVFLAALAAAPAAMAGPTYHGLMLHTLWGDTPQDGAQRELGLTQDLGANVVRLDVGWASLETEGKGQYSQWYVDRLDKFMNEADARGIKVIASVMQTPCWASSAPDSLKQGCAGSWWDRGVVQYPPNNPDDYGDIMRWMTSRYGTKLAAVEVWNEPNLPEPRFWKSNDPAGDYAKLVRAAYGPAKQGNPNVSVLAGALGAADGDFLQKLYDDGIKGYFDGISIHPYNEWRDPADNWQAQYKKYTLMPGSEWVHQVQQANGDNSKLWLTELGWPTCTGINWCVSQQQQADYTARAVQLIEQVPYVEAYTFYDLRNEGNDPTVMDDNFGVVDHDYNPKPVYASLKGAWHGAYPAASSSSSRSGSGSGSGSHSGSSTGSGTGVGAGILGTVGSRTLRVKVKTSHGYLVVYGSAPRGSRVELTVTRCKPKCKRVRIGRSKKAIVKTRANGRFSKKIGKLKALKKSKLNARVVGPTTVVSAGVRAVGLRIR